MSLPVITPLPEPPSRLDDPANFNLAADNFMSALPALVTELNEFGPALVAAASGADYSATSTTSRSIGTGSKSFTTQSGKLFVAGQFVIVADAAAPTTNYMVGQVTSYVIGTGALTVNVTTAVGSGTKTSWLIGLTGPVGATGAAGATGPTGPAGPGSVSSVNGDSGPNITLTANEIGDGGSSVIMTTSERSKLSGIESGATADQTADEIAALIDGDTSSEQTLASALAGNATALNTLRDAIKPLEFIVIAASDEVTPLTTGTSKVTFRMPYAFTLTGIRASLSVAQSSGSIVTVDVNDGGSTIMSASKLRFDNGERSTVTYSGTAAALSDTSLADDAEITVDIDQIGNGTAKGLKVALIGRRT